MLYVYWHFFLFPQYFFVFYHLSNVNPFPNKPWVLCVCSTNLLKTLWENVQFLLFPQCFLPIRRTAIFIKFEIVVCKVSQFRPVRNIVVWKNVKFFVCKHFLSLAQMANLYSSKLKDFANNNFIVD